MRCRILHPVVVAIACGVALPLSQLAHGGDRSAADSSSRSNADVYASACAACHGSDGTGAPRTRVAFNVPLPDFTDCNFATREPNADWFAVAHNGGRARGFDRMMPAFGEALSDREIEQALSHIRSLCDDRSWPRGGLNYPRALVTEKAYPEDELVVELVGTIEEPHAFEAQLVLEKRLGSRHQVEVILPFAVQQVKEEREGETSELRWGEGIGDIPVGVKSVLFHDLAWESIASLGAEVILPTGDEQDGLGSGTFLFEPFLSVGQGFSSFGFVQLQGGGALSADTERAEHEVFWRIALGRSFVQGRFGRVWTPMVEVTGDVEPGTSAPPDWNVVPQLHVSLNQRQHVRANLGVSLPVNDFEQRQVRVMSFLLWDWFDGGFFEGW